MIICAVTVREKFGAVSGRRAQGQRKGPALQRLMQYLLGNVGAAAASAGAAGTTLKFRKAANALGCRLADGPIGDAIAKADVHVPLTG